MTQKQLVSKIKKDLKFDAKVDGSVLTIKGYSSFKSFNLLNLLKRRNAFQVQIEGIFNNLSIEYNLISFTNEIDNSDYLFVWKYAIGVRG